MNTARHPEDSLQHEEKIRDEIPKQKCRSGPFCVVYVCPYSWTSRLLASIVSYTLPSPGVSRYPVWAVFRFGIVRPELDRSLEDSTRENIV